MTRDFRFAKGSRFIPQAELNLIGTAAALIGIGIAGAVGGVATAAIGSRAAGKAATVQADASTQAALLQKQAADEALAFQRQQWTTAQGQIAPWLQAGQGAITNLQSLMGIPGVSTTAAPAAGGAPSGTLPGAVVPPGAGGIPAGGAGRRDIRFGDRGDISPGNGRGKFAIEASTDPTVNIDTFGNEANPPVDESGNPIIPPAGTPTGTPSGTPGVNPALGAFGSLAQPWTDQFAAPTEITQQNDPGYAWRLKEGQRLLENSAAARGGLLTGSTAQDIQRYGQEYASNEYGNVYERALREYQQRYNVFQQNQSNLYNRLAGLSGAGQTATGQLTSAGDAASRNATNILLTSGQQQGQALNNAAQARASGYINSANAWGGAIRGGVMSLQDYLAGRG